MSRFSGSSPPCHNDLWIDHPEGRLFARVWGAAASAGAPEAAPIILLHDSLGCTELWRDFPVRLALATGRQIVAYDRLGFGRSCASPARLPSNFITAEACENFALVRAALGIGRFVLFGHSVGGGIAAHCAGRFGADCEGLIVVSAQAFVEEHTLEGIKAAGKAFRDPGQFSRLEKYHGPKARWVLDAWVDTWLSPAFSAWTLADGLGVITAPALVIHGEKDEFASVSQAQRIASLCSGPTRLAIMPDTFHFPHREQPEYVVQQVVRLLGEQAHRLA